MSQDTFKAKGPDNNPNPEEPDTRMKQVCDGCGGENVSADATVRWDMDLQDWVISGIHDGDYCDDCEDECRIREVPE